MRAITIYEPWASLIALGAKTLETRSWPTNYRGPIAIHAGQSMNYLPFACREPFATALISLKDEQGGFPRSAFRFGCVIAVADLVACIQMTPQNIAMVDEPERSFGDYEPGRWMWLLANVRRIDPVPVRGRQGLWIWAPLVDRVLP